MGVSLFDILADGYGRIERDSHRFAGFEVWEFRVDHALFEFVGISVEQVCFGALSLGIVCAHQLFGKVFVELVCASERLAYALERLISVKVYPLFFISCGKLAIERGIKVFAIETVKTVRVAFARRRFGRRIDAVNLSRVILTDHAQNLSGFGFDEEDMGGAPSEFGNELEERGIVKAELEGDNAVVVGDAQPCEHRVADVFAQKHRECLRHRRRFFRPRGGIDVEMCRQKINDEEKPRARIFIAIFFERELEFVLPVRDVFQARVHEVEGKLFDEMAKFWVVHSF